MAHFKRQFPHDSWSVAPDALAVSIDAELQINCLFEKSSEIKSNYATDLKPRIQTVPQLKIWTRITVQRGTEIYGASSRREHDPQHRFQSRWKLYGTILEALTLIHSLAKQTEPIYDGRYVLSRDPCAHIWHAHCVHLPWSMGISINSRQRKNELNFGHCTAVQLNANFTVV